ncbi:MAG: hypothetical protein PHH54_00405 [Candidatus Nanoarchaeia archaeon]|nr:hypothetical protein [Candidatus Nanoarchaeia archaeon]MDD5740424.1 hypothetical protein [Candidatus Nanoarchaeia archaeon]
MAEDKLSMILGLELSSKALEHYFSLKKRGISSIDVAKEFVIELDKKSIDLKQMIEDFTYAFLGDKDAQKWSQKKPVLGKMQDDRKYALRLIGQHVKNDGKTSEEERGFDYIISHLRYLNKTKDKDQKIKSDAYARLHGFFDYIAQEAEKEVSKLF